MREPAGQDDRIGAPEIVVAVPDVSRVRTFAAQSVDDVLLAVGAGEDDDRDAGSQMGSSSTV
jgi:hypothetical protein